VRLSVLFLGTVIRFLDVSGRPNFVRYTCAWPQDEVNCEREYSPLPAGTLVDDRILIFKDGGFPLIARLITLDHWRLIGRSYLYSLMQSKEFNPYIPINIWLV